MLKAIKSLLIFILIIFTFLIQPCYALGLFSQQSLVLQMGPCLAGRQAAKSVCSQQRSFCPSETKLHSEKFFAPRRYFNRGLDLARSNFLRAVHTQLLPPIVGRDKQCSPRLISNSKIFFDNFRVFAGVIRPPQIFGRLIKKHSPSGSVLRLQLYDSFGLCVFFENALRSLRVREPDFVG